MGNKKWRFIMWEFVGCFGDGGDSGIMWKYGFYKNICEYRYSLVLKFF